MGRVAVDAERILIGSVEGDRVAGNRIVLATVCRRDIEQSHAPFRHVVGPGCGHGIRGVFLHDKTGDGDPVRADQFENGVVQIAHSLGA